MSDRVYLDGEAHLIEQVDGDSSGVIRYEMRGYSAYDIAVQNGFVGTEAEWLASLIGPQGLQGERGLTGETGPAGPQGERGLTGETGPAGPQGKTGEAGPAGPQGKTGETGPAGPQGERGPVGETGERGPAGESITVVSTKYEGGITYVYLSDGTYFGVHDGIQGPQGEPGADAPGYFVVEAAPPEILVDVIMEITNPGQVWTNDSKKAFSINSSSYIFEADGVRSEEIEFVRYKDTELNAYYYTGTCDELGITVKYYYGGNYKQYSSVTFTNPPSLFRLLEKTGEAEGETTGGVVDLAEGYTAGESLRGPKGDKGDTGPAGPQGPAYVLTEADRAAIVAAIEADYDNGDTASYGA